MDFLYYTRRGIQELETLAIVGRFSSFLLFLSYRDVVCRMRIGIARAIFFILKAFIQNPTPVRQGLVDTRRLYNDTIARTIYEIF